MEELGLLRDPILMPNDLCRLEIIGQINLALFIALLLNFALNFFFMLLSSLNWTISSKAFLSFITASLSAGSLHT